MALPPGQCASSRAPGWLTAATRRSTRSSRVRTTVRSARVSSEYGVATRSRCWRSRRYSAITSASPESDLAPDSTSLSRQALIAFGLTGTTGCPTSSSASTRTPDGRSIATGISAGSPSPASLRISLPRPSALCATVNRATTFPAAPITHTACVSAAQSIPVQNTAPGTESGSSGLPCDGSDNPAAPGLAPGRSLTGALRRISL